MTEQQIIKKIKVTMKNNNSNTPTAIFIDGDWLYATTKRINKNVDYAKFFNTCKPMAGSFMPIRRNVSDIIKIIPQVSSF